jgi:hypothetical protein
MLGKQRHLHTGLQRLDLWWQIGGNDGSLWRRAGLGEGGEREEEEEAFHACFIKRGEETRLDKS